MKTTTVNNVYKGKEALHDIIQNKLKYRNEIDFLKVWPSFTNMEHKFKFLKKIKCAFIKLPPTEIISEILSICKKFKDDKLAFYYLKRLPKKRKFEEFRCKLSS
mmetsp:Transcript_19558/g.9088  ORF Transcript_19558/g.9088 Transcript_19558/m.9088 type:complete len:104 (-) Transcript_19558:72-383(-)